MEVLATTVVCLFVCGVSVYVEPLRVNDDILTDCTVRLATTLTHPTCYNCRNRQQSTSDYHVVTMDVFLCGCILMLSW